MIVHASFIYSIFFYTCIKWPVVRRRLTACQSLTESFRLYFKLSIGQIFISRLCWFVRLNAHTVPVEDGTIVSQVCNILKTPKPTITTNVVNVCFQTGGSNSDGVRLVFDLCAGVDPVNEEYVQSEMMCKVKWGITAFQALFATSRREHSLKYTARVEGQVDGVLWWVQCLVSWGVCPNSNGGAQQRIRLKFLGSMCER